MDIPITVAGNFMELRTNHFHSGLDMKTNGVIGQPVKAVADGWVSRIKISPWGYGKAVYVDHPSGYTTVYGHLDRLNGAIAKATMDAQYAARDFSIDRYYTKGELPVKAGEVIAFSGNTGGSTAPHLHFEVRRTSDQHALDPEAYGMDVSDRVPPTISGIRIEALDSTSRTSPYASGARGIAVYALNDSTFHLKPGSNPAAFGRIGISVNAIDRYSGSSNTCGIRSLEVSVDGTPVFSAHLDEVDFGLQRYANAYMDYGLFKSHNMHYNRCYKLPNNRLKVYGPETAQGRIEVVPGKDHAVQVKATDANGNRSTLTFVLHGATPEIAAGWPRQMDKGILFPYAKSNSLSMPGLLFDLPAGALYEDQRIGYSAGATPAHALAPLHTIQDRLTPLHLAGTIKIDVTGKFPAGKASKLLIVRMDRGHPSPQGGTFQNGAVSTSIKELGSFTVMIDTTAPTIDPLDLRSTMTGRKSFQLRVRDNLSGIDQWVGRLDGEWILLEYEHKTHTLRHTFDEHSDLPGKHVLTVEVADERGNSRTYTTTFTR